MEPFPIFLDHGWGNYAETFLFVWGIAILVMKWRKNQHQAQAALLQLFPELLGREINSSNVGGFIDNIYKTHLTLRDSLIVNRIRKALELFELRVDNGDVAAFLSTQPARQDEGARRLGGLGWRQLALHDSGRRSQSAPKTATTSGGAQAPASDWPET